MTLRRPRPQRGKGWNELRVADLQASRHSSLWRRKNRTGRPILKDGLLSSSRFITENLPAVFCGTRSALPAKHARKVLLRLKPA